MKESGLLFLYVYSISILGFFICGYLGENIGWHYGFGAAGIGMLLGVLQYKFNLKSLGDVGLKPTNIINQKTKNTYKKITFTISLLILIFIFSGLVGLWSINLCHTNILTLIIASLVSCILFIYFLGQLNEDEKKKIVMIFSFLLGQRYFGQVLIMRKFFNIFAEYTNRIIFGCILGVGYKY